MLTATLENPEAFASLWEKRVVRVIRDGLRKAVNRAAREGASEARQRHQFKNRTGALERSIGSVVDAGSTNGDYGAEIVALESYASLVEGGHRPHEIRARRQAALAFVNRSGQLIFRVRVMHPGAKAHPFMSFAYFKAERVLIREVELSIAKAQEALNQ